jgi:hypothetical protein
MITAKDFKAIAEIVKRYVSKDYLKGTDYFSYQLISAECFINSLMDYFASQNIKFDRERFLKACGVTE